MEKLTDLPAKQNFEPRDIELDDHKLGLLDLVSVDELSPATTVESTGDIASLSDGHFQHTPLDLTGQAIRVLKIHTDEPDGPGGVLSTSLRDVELGSEPFVCLSYVWGTELHDEPILVNGRPFQIYENAWQALSALRNKQLRFPLWIDGVCIDQSNVEERNHQVHQMAEIYRTASDVIVWLGASSFHQEEVLLALGGTTHSFGYERSHDELFLLLTDTGREQERISSFEAQHWQAFRQLCHNAYWTRSVLRIPN
jgi:hypothetical protein